MAERLRRRGHWNATGSRGWAGVLSMSVRGVLASHPASRPVSSPATSAGVFFSLFSVLSFVFLPFSDTSITTYLVNGWVEDVLV